MSEKDCQDNTPCTECEDTGLTTPPPCESGTPECPNPDKCPETFAEECVVWTGDDLMCGNTVIATEGDRMDIVQRRILLLACDNLGTSSADLLTPAPNESIIGTTERLIQVNRNNCHEVITFTPQGAPSGLLFNYTDEDGVVQSGESDIVLAPSQASVIFDMDTSGVEPGDYSFTLEATACGYTMVANVSITIT